MKSFNEYKIIIYTNHADMFDKEFKKNNIDLKSNIYIEEVDNETVSKWIYDQYLARIKIYILKLFFDKYNADALFFDSDIFVLNKITPFFDHLDRSEFILYKTLDTAETIYSLASHKVAYYEKFYLFLLRTNGAIRHDHIYRHSGVIGLPLKYKNIIDDVMTLCNEMYNYTQYWGSEEIAFSCIFQNNNKISFADNIVNDFSNCQLLRLFLAYTFQIYLEHDKRRLNEYLKIYKLDILFLDKLCLRYDDILNFYHIFRSYIMGLELNAEKLYSNIGIFKTSDFDRYCILLDKFRNQLTIRCNPYVKSSIK